MLMISYTSGIKNSFGDTVASLNYVVLVLIVSAGALAFVVLYNLTNINVAERLREIATIKVLGFYDKEVSAYIFRENVALTLMGTVAGLLGGIWLHRFVITTAEIDTIMFGRTVAPLSYLLSEMCIRDRHSRCRRRGPPARPGPRPAGPAPCSCRCAGARCCPGRRCPSRS